MAHTPNRRLFLCLVFFLSVTACAPAIEHDPQSAGKRAVDFAEVAFVRQDGENAYAMLADKTRGYVPLAKFKETLSRLYSGAHPTRVRAIGYEPMPGEKAIYIYVVAEVPGGQLPYTVTMEGTAATGYKVSKIVRGDSSYLPSTSEKKRFDPPISPS